MSCDDRSRIADELYLERGARDAAHRCDVNARLGDFDLGAALADSLQLRAGETHVDVGCGSGQHLATLASHVAPGGHAAGFDISAEAVASTRKLGLEAEVADAANLPVRADFANAITCIFAIYYHPDLPAVVREFERVLQKGGRLAVAGPARGTNCELYEFHRRATGAEPSDADRIALGYVETDVKIALEAENFDQIDVKFYSNRIEFPNAPSFLDYWKATSLFARTPGARYEDGAAIIDSPEKPFTVTKRIALLTAHKK